MPMKGKFQPSVTFAFVVLCLSFVIETHWCVENTKTSKNYVNIHKDIPNQMLLGSSPPGNHGNLRVAHPPRNFQPAFERSFQGFMVLLHKKSCYASNPSEQKRQALMDELELIEFEELKDKPLNGNSKTNVGVPVVSGGNT